MILSQKGHVSIGISKEDKLEAIVELTTELACIYRALQEEYGTVIAITMIEASIHDVFDEKENNK